jgi:hypothetical protein
MITQHHISGDKYFEKSQKSHVLTAVDNKWYIATWIMKGMRDGGNGWEHWCIFLIIMVFQRW